MLHQQHCLGSTPTCFHTTIYFQWIHVAFRSQPNAYEDAILEHTNPQGLYFVSGTHTEKPTFRKICEFGNFKMENEWWLERVYFHRDGTHPGKVLWVLKCLSICFRFLVSMLVIMFVWSICLFGPFFNVGEYVRNIKCRVQKRK